MTDLQLLLSAARDGLVFGVQFNPLWAIGTAAVAAALWGYPKAPKKRAQWAALAIVAGWLVGDGLRILARSREYYDSSATFAKVGLPVWTGWVHLGVWALVSLALGYAIPALVGAAVGRRVTHGTGWLAAAGIAAALALAASKAAGAL